MAPLVEQRTESRPEETLNGHRQQFVPLVHCPTSYGPSELGRRHPLGPAREGTGVRSGEERADIDIAGARLTRVLGKLQQRDEGGLPGRAELLLARTLPPEEHQSRSTPRVRLCSVGDGMGRTRPAI